MNSDDKQFQQLQLSQMTKQIAHINDMQQMLVPVYLPKHWGLIFIDLVNQELYFDDGLMVAVPRMALPYVKKSLELLLEIHPCHLALKLKFWQNCVHFQRFGMPSQALVNPGIIGAGNCGIGVIMAAKDFIENGSASLNNFQWRFCEMDLHRKHFMLQILNWRVP